jgi:hypothetical protein
MILNKNHRLYQLSEVIDWAYLESKVQQSVGVMGTEKCRLITGLLYVKTMMDVSSEEVLEIWLECPYLRHFCGVDPEEIPEKSPCLPGVLDMWDREYSGKPYDSMTYALFRASVFDKIAA